MIGMVLDVLKIVTYTKGKLYAFGPFRLIKSTPTWLIVSNKSSVSKAPKRNGRFLREQL
jgi:hypothetical protein